MTYNIIKTKDAICTESGFDCACTMQRKEKDVVQSQVFTLQATLIFKNLLNEVLTLARNVTAISDDEIVFFEHARILFSFIIKNSYNVGA